MGKVDIITSTLGKALGGSAGGFVSGHQAIVDLLRQRARPYLFSNTLTPPVVRASIRALELVSDAAVGGEMRRRLWANTKRFRDANGEGWLHNQAGRASCRACDVGRCQTLSRIRARADGRRRLCGWFLFPSCAERPSQNSGSTFSRTLT